MPEPLHGLGRRDPDALFPNDPLQYMELSEGDAAQGMVLGSPFRLEIERRDSAARDRAVNAVTEALRSWDGEEAQMSARVATATK